MFEVLVVLLIILFLLYIFVFLIIVLFVSENIFVLVNKKKLEDNLVVYYGK